MKKYIREILHDLKRTARPNKSVTAVSPAVPDVVPQDLNNQILSSDPAQRVRQLDQQAQESEERQTLG
jgi:hypothetical protein